MSRPFPNTFETDTPMSPASAISYSANVNRQKTKKWTEAKPVDYGGDDWGDDDEYEYDLPPPPPKPTGLRQPGQALQSPARTGTPVMDNSKKYGDLPPLPGPSDQRARANSFDADDEKRNFSNSTAPHPSAPVAPASGPATRFSQITGVPTVRNASGPPQLSISTQQPSQPSVGLRKPPNAMVSPISDSPRPEISKPGRFDTVDSNIVSPASDTPASIHGRRDFSPSAVPLPLSTRDSPAPQSGQPETSTARFPARKSSLSQISGPPLSEVRRETEQSTPKPWVADRSASPGATARSPSTPTTKALPFIRPADIYRRVEEERERERQSMDSSRPSMDSIVGSKSSEPRTSLDGDEASESGRQLRPTLEPVKERKSEYGFEGFNVHQANTQAKPQEDSSNADRPGTSESDHLEIEEARRSSMSPKLPDLARLSGFGLDMFSQPKVEAPTSHPIEHPEKSLATAEPLATDDLSLHSQPSLGFRGVVNQAFERKDDSSVPPTPSSRGVGRTDSESTGTDGISPIMSRVPSSAVPKNRDLGTPSILEVVNEPNSPESSAHLQNVHPSSSQNDNLQGVVSGYRHNMRTPSPGNSPSRTPIVGKPSIETAGHQAIHSQTSAESGPGGNDAPQLLRPGADREQSFRPPIPGGWTSYATTARSESPTKPHNELAHASVVEPIASPAHNEEDELDLTPTTTKPSLPQSPIGATIVAATVPVTSLGKHDQASPGATPTTQTPILAASQPSLPTPDPSMAPSGNVYSSTALDPRYFPNPGQAPPESQLRPDVINRAISADSSAAPTPPPKDTPAVESPDHDSEYFPKPTVPLKSKSPRHAEDDKFLGALGRPQMAPTLSTDTGLHDDENDKLRKEIVKSLSPGVPESSQTEGNILLDEVDDGNVGNQYRESTYLPSEYDNYWATTGEETETIPAVATVTGPIQEPAQHTQPESPTVAPLSPRREENALLQPSRPSVTHRFSWERSTESVPLAQTEESLSGAPVHELHGSLPGPLAQDQQNLTGGPGGLAPAELETPRSSIVSPDNEPDHPDRHSLTQTFSDEGHAGRDAALVAGGAVLAGAAAASYAAHTPDRTDRRLSLAEQKDPQVSSYPVSPTPPEDEHPARSPHPYFSPSAEGASLHQPLSAISPVTSSIEQQYSPSSRPLAFKQIAAINSQHERIQTYDQTRQHYASMNSGLNDWIAALQSQYPEHANVTSTFGGSRMSAPSGSARSKFGKATGVGAPAQQQPYFQQYLNASPTTQPIPASRPGPGSVPSGSQSGFGASSTKLTSHQVQAKGKELLHTAGIFGGKAGKAGKGLLAKGKNKLRGAGGGDKTTPSPPSKPKTERRSSWGFPLNLSRSSGRPESSPHSLRYRSHTHEPTSQRPRAATLTSSADVPAPQIPHSVGTDSFVLASGALHTDAQHVEPQPYDGQPTTPRRDIIPNETSSAGRSTDMAENRDVVGIPAPISKDQPSWDPFNSLPIAEEEGYQVEDLAQSPSQPETGNTKPQESLPVLTNTLSETGLLKSDAAGTQDVPEPSDISDEWVVVSAKPELEEEPAAQHLSQPVNVVQAPIPEPALESPSDRAEHRVSNMALPNPNASSILNRPRGSYEIPSAEAITLSSSLSQPPVKYVPPPLPPIPQEPPSTTPSFLPPIRRTSTFAVGFNPRQTRTRKLQGDEEDTQQRKTEDDQLQHDDIAESGKSVIQDVTKYETVEHVEHVNARVEPNEVRPMRPLSFVRSGPLRDPAVPQAPSGVQGPRNPQVGFQEAPGEHPLEKPTSSSPPVQPNPSPAMSRSPFLQNPSSKFSQAPSGDPEKPALVDHRATEIPLRPENFHESQVEWRQSRQRPSVPMSRTTPAYWKEREVSPPRESFDGQRERGYSSSSQSNIEKSSSPYNDRTPRYGPVEQSRPFIQPPSSAQRYPELFRPGQQGHDVHQDEGELPAQYYQAPIPRNAAFLPRHQTNEYQLPGVGPPVNEPRENGNRRNPGFFKEIGGRLSRGSSRERPTPVPRDSGISSPIMTLDSPTDDYGAPSIISDATQDQRKRWSNFFGPSSRASVTGLGPPASRESVIAHPAGSRLDLVSSPQPTPIIKHDRKRSFFGSNTNEPKPKGNKLMRASTGTMVDDKGRKKRFSGLSGLFGKSSQSAAGSVDGRPQATRELSQNERQPIESPQLGHSQLGQSQPSRFQAPERQKPVNASKHFLTKSTQPREDSKSRRPSASTLFGNLMGRKSHQQDRGTDESRSQGSSSQTQNGLLPLPPPQTYTDLQQQRSTPPPQAREPAFRHPTIPPPSLPHPERGRKINREPQYDSVPIPGGYSLVRGDGSVPAPTQYDPRGLNRHQYFDPRYPQSQNQHWTPQNHPDVEAVRQQYQNGQQYPISSPQPSRPTPPPLSTTPRLTPPPFIDGSQRPVTPRRLSREDVLARSPPKSPVGQQRPYQLSLPDGNAVGEAQTPPNLIQKDATHFPNASQKDPIQRPQQPTLRHPESPAGYPLPDDDVFSPVNEAASDMPPPPPPKWPAHLDAQHQNGKNGHGYKDSLAQSLLTIDLDRSNTRRTAVSAVSVMSGPTENEQQTPGTERDKRGDNLSVPENSGNGRRSITPTPPSPMGSPKIKRTEIDLAPKEDLYDASPRLPKLTTLSTPPSNQPKVPAAAANNNTQPRAVEGNGKVVEGEKAKEVQEEKILYDHNHGHALSISGDEREEHEAATMSATSYPGQEWNPYGMGNWEEGFD